MTATLRTLTAEHDTRGARRLAALNDPDAGTLVAAVAPGTTRRFELGWCLLEALGKRQDVSGHGRHDQLNWEVLHAWLLAHRVRRLVLLDAQWLTTELVGAVAGLVATCGLDVWLVAHLPVEPPYIAALDGWPHRAARGADLLADMGGLSPRPDPLDTGDFPEVPTDNWPTFRAACRDCLDPHDFERVDALFLRTLVSAEGIFRGDEVTESSVLTGLRSDLESVETVAEMVTVVRAFQVAAHREGWLLQAKIARLRATAETMSRAALRSPATWHKLRAYRMPYRGAAVALAAIGLSVGIMMEIRCADVAADGASVHRDGTTHAIPPEAAVFLRAQREYRILMGASPTDLLFADDEGPLHDRALADALRRPAAELGIPVPDISMSRAPDPHNSRWRDRWGLSLQKLSR